MRLGVSSHAFRWAIGWADFVQKNRLDIAGFLDECRRVEGAQGVQICDNVQPERLGHEHKQRQAVEAAIKDGFFVELGAQGTDPAYLETMLTLSKELGATVLRVATAVTRSGTARSVEEQLRKIEGELRAILSLARRLGVRLAIENHWEVTSSQLLDLVRSVNDEHVGVCLDTANSVASAEDPLTTVGLLAPYALDVHLKDFRIERDLARDPAGYRIIGTALGEGWLPADEVVKRIRTKSPAESCHVELFLDRAATERETVAQERDAVARSVATARRLLGV
jgi:sugar phosphate isomerase/epimerase